MFNKSICEQGRIEGSMERMKKYWQQHTPLQENEINSHFQIRDYKNKIEFYNRVQKNILEECSLYLDELCETMIGYARNALKIDKVSREDSNTKLSEKMKVYYESLINKTYIFPTNLKIEEIIFEETRKIDVDIKKKRKNRKRRKMTTPVYSAVTALDLKEGETSSLAKLSQDETDIKTEKEPPLVAHAEESEDLRNLLPEGNLKEENSNWKDNLNAQIQKDREKKIVSKKRPRINRVEELQPILIKKAEIGKTEHLFFTKVCTTSVKNPNIAWKDLVNLFNNPNGFKGNVYGASGGVNNTFEVFMKFKDGKFIDFLSKKEFNSLKSKAKPESRKERNFLKDNKRLESYRLPAGESIATSSFMLHRPHQPCLYMALIKRLRGQLDFLGLSPETVQSRE